MVRVHAEHAAGTWPLTRSCAIVEVDGYRPVKSADRTLDVLEALGRSSARRTLGELSRDLGIPKSSLHAILRTMEQRGWIETDVTGHLVGLGVRSLLIGAAYLDSDYRVVQLQGLLNWLSEQTGETVHLGRLDGPDIVYLAKRESSHSLRLFSAIGRRLPAHATALGKAILSTRIPEIDTLLTWPLPRLTAQTITDREDLVAELRATEARGYAVDNEENTEGIRCFSIPVRTQNVVVDAISLSIPLARLTPERTSEVVGILQASREQITEARLAVR